MFENYDDIVSVAELRTMLHIGRNSAYKLLSTKQIKAKRMNTNGKYIIAKKNIIDYVNRSQQSKGL
jgi:hypothetical protein